MDVVSGYAAVFVIRRAGSFKSSFVLKEVTNVIVSEIHISASVLPVFCHHPGHACYVSVEGLLTKQELHWTVERHKFPIFKNLLFNPFMVRPLGTLFDLLLSV
jgi:hypothetical protein